MKIIRVAMIIHGYYPRVGGAEVQLRALVPYLQKHGIELHILTRRYESSLPARECLDGVDVYRIPVPGPRVIASLIFTVIAFLRVRSIKPQIVHAHEFISPATVALLAKSWLKIPIVVTSHRSGPLGDVQKMRHKFFGKARLNALRKKVDKFVVISREIAEELQTIGISTDKLVRVTNGVDIDRFLPPTPDRKCALRIEAGFASDDLIAIFTGRLVPEKRLDLLLSIWPLILQDYPNAKLLIVGAGLEEQHLRTIAGTGVTFMGSTTDVTPFLQLSDVFVLPSVAEGLSVALLEAMSCGLVPVITDVGGAREVVVDGQNGLIVPPDDGDALVAALKDVFGNKQFLAGAAQAARQRVVEHFSVRFAAEKLSRLYGDLVGGDLS